MDPHQRLLQQFIQQSAAAAGRPVYLSASPFQNAATADPVIRYIHSARAPGPVPCVIRTGAVPVAVSAAGHVLHGVHPSLHGAGHVSVPMTVAAVQTLTRMTTHVSVQAAAAARHVAPTPLAPGARCVMVPVGGSGFPRAAATPATARHYSPGNPAAQHFAGVSLQRPQQILQQQQAAAVAAAAAGFARAAVRLANPLTSGILVNQVPANAVIIRNDSATPTSTPSASASGLSPTPKIVEIIDDPPAAGSPGANATEKMEITEIDDSKLTNPSLVKSAVSTSSESMADASQTSDLFVIQKAKRVRSNSVPNISIDLDHIAAQQQSRAKSPKVSGSSASPPDGEVETPSVDESSMNGSTSAMEPDTNSTEGEDSSLASNLPLSHESPALEKRPLQNQAMGEGLQDTICELALQPQLPQSSSSNSGSPEANPTSHPMEGSHDEDTCGAAGDGIGDDSHQDSASLLNCAEVSTADVAPSYQQSSSKRPIPPPPVVIHDNDEAARDVRKGDEEETQAKTIPEAGNSDAAIVQPEVPLTAESEPCASFVTIPTDLNAARLSQSKPDLASQVDAAAAAAAAAAVASVPPAAQSSLLNQYATGGENQQQLLPVFVVDTVTPNSTQPPFSVLEPQQQQQQQQHHTLHQQQQQQQSGPPHFCLQCSRVASPACQSHSQFVVKPSSITSQHIRDTVVPSQARLSIPQCLEIKIVTRTVQSSLFTLNDSREGIWVRIGEETIPAGTLFGPLKGEVKEIVRADNAEEMRRCIENRHYWNLGVSTGAEGGDGYVATFLDVSDEQKSNWMRFVKKWVGSESGEESNLTAILHERKIYFVASQPLRPGEELCFWYAKDYLSLLDVQDFSNKVESLNASGAAAGEKNPSTSTTTVTPSSAASSAKSKSGAGGSKEKNKSHSTSSASEGKAPASLLACYVCRKSNFESRDALVDHIRESHPEEAVVNDDCEGGAEALTCEVCLKTFSSSSTLNKHKRYHMVSKKYKCHACNVCFKQKSHLANHLIMHTKDKRFMCKLCSTLFGRISDLRCHVKTVHNAEKTFPCTYCSKKFKTVKILNKHVSKHLFRFCCARCKKSFASNYHLKRHEIFSSCLNKAIGKVNGEVAACDK